MKPGLTRTALDARGRKGFRPRGMSKLVDLQWKFGVTASTDEVQAAGVAFLQLKLAMAAQKGANGEDLEHIAMEMTLPEFYHFLSEIQKAKAVMDSY
mmetsp:Transcript_22213/g.42305  ORF Transcript_22213/g.42305 Transcript_22213/m.42305 type:complete len:97 (+) Transcript_22213:13-303(+)